MKRPFLILIVFVLGFHFAYSQHKAKYEVKEIEGYYIWEMRYDSVVNIFYPKAIYIIANDNKGTKLSIGHTSTTLKLCNEKRSMAKYRRSLKSKKVDPIDNYYSFYRDTTSIVAASYITIEGAFYKSDSIDLYLAYKTKAKVLIYDNLCEEFEKERRLHSRCGTLFKGPYAATKNY